MVSNILPFPKRSTNDRDAETQARNAKKIEKIRKRIAEGRRRFPSRKDSVIAAMAIRRLVQRAMTEGHKQANMERDGALPRLQRHMAKHAHQSGPIPSLTFTTQIDNYLRIARYIAQKLDLDPVQEQARVLSGTSLWTNPEFDGPSDERAEELTLLLNETAARVMRDTRFESLISRMTRTPGRWDASGRSFRPDGRPCLVRQPYQGWFEDWSEAPPFPYIPLLAIPHAEFPRRIRIAPASSGEETWADAVFVLEREIGLCIGLTLSADAIGAMFETRARTSIRLISQDGVSKTYLLDPPWSLLVGADDKLHAVIDGVRRQLAPDRPLLAETPKKAYGGPSRGNDGDPLSWPFSPLDALEPQCFEHYYFSWTPVDAAHVSYWLDREASQVLDLVPQDQSQADTTDTTWYHDGRFARRLELALYSETLFAALRSSTEHLRAAFEEHERSWRAKAEATSTSLLARLQSDFQSGVIDRKDGRETATNGPIERANDDLGVES